MREFLDRLEDIVVGMLLVAITLLVFAEVVMRFGFNSGIHWAQEATLLMSAWMVLLGASWCVREKAHISIDVLVVRLPEVWRRGVTLFAVALCLVYCGLFLYGSWIYLNKLYIIGIELEDIPVPKWLAQSILLIGFALLAFRFLEFGVQVARGQADSFHRHAGSMLDNLHGHTGAPPSAGAAQLPTGAGDWQGRVLP